MDDVYHESSSGRLAHKLVGDILEMTDAERLNAFAIIKASYCLECGSYHGDRPRQCQCWNDE